MSLQYHSQSTPSERESPKTWYGRLSQALQDGHSQQRAVVRNFVDEHVRQQFTDGSESVSVQEELLYETDATQMFDDFVAGIADTDVYVPASVYGAEQLVVEATAQFHDTAQLAETHQHPTTVTPSFESTVWVSCELGVRARVGNYTDTDVSCRVYVPDAEN